MPSVPATGGSGESRPQRSEPSASGATPPCSSSIAEAGSWIASNPCKGHSHRLERTRFLLQKRPGRGGVRRSGAASLPSAAPGLQHSRILGVEALGRGDRVWPLLERRPAKRAGPARSGAPAQDGPSRTLRMVRPAPASVGR